MNIIKSLSNDPIKVQQKLQGKQFLLGKYFDLKKSNKCKKHKKFIKSKRQKLLNIQIQIYQNQQLLINTITKVQAQAQDQNKQLKIQEKIKQKQQDKIQQKQQDKIQTKHKYYYNYEFFLPLHILWKSYISDLIQQQNNQQSRNLKLLRSDFLGSQILIIYSKIQSYIGHMGIIIKQTLKSFIMIKKQQNKIIRLLKSQIIFTFTQSSIQKIHRNYIINGNTLIYRPSDRTKHKFKFKITQKLNHNYLELYINNNKQDQDYNNNQKIQQQ